MARVSDFRKEIYSVKTASLVNVDEIVKKQLHSGVMKAQLINHESDKEQIWEPIEALNIKCHSTNVLFHAKHGDLGGTKDACTG